MVVLVPPLWAAFPRYRALSVVSISTVKPFTTRCKNMHKLCKYKVSQSYGGSQEGGWWYDQGFPVWKISIPIPFEELAYKVARFFNRREQARRNKENKYGYTSVLSYRDTFFDYGFSDTLIPKPFPSTRPHYE